MARYIKKNGILKPVSGAQFADTPIGTVIASFLAVAPSGYIKCDGTVYTKADYPELYERIPDVFKDTTNETFTIDLREVALKGIGLSSLTSNHYSSTGLTLGEFIEDRLQNHVHSQSAVLKLTYGYSTSNRVPTTGGGNYSLPPLTGGASEVFSTQTSSILSSGTARYGDTTEVKAVGVNYFIKAKQIGVPADIMAGIEENFATKEYVDEKRFADWSTSTLVQTGTSGWVADKDYDLQFLYNYAYTSSSLSIGLEIDGVRVSYSDSAAVSTNLYMFTCFFSGLVKKGSTVTFKLSGTATNVNLRVAELV